MRTSYVGLDVHSKMSQFVIQDRRGKLRSRGEFPTTAAGLRWLKSEHGLAPGTRVALETGTMANYVARQLQDLKLEPVVVDAHEVRLKAYRPQQKSDRRDAFEICEGLRRDQYRAIVHIPPVPIQTLRETLSRRRHFVRLQSAEVNAVKYLLRASGRQNLSVSLRLESGWKKLMSQVKDAQLKSRIELHHQVWRAAGIQVASLESSLEKQSRFFEADVRRLQTAPGVGPIVALTAIATFSDVNRFPSAKCAASYVGIVPGTNQSGDRDWHGHIIKKGASELRSMLCEASQHGGARTIR